MPKAYIRIPRDTTDRELMYIHSIYYIGNTLTGHDDKDYIITNIEERSIYKETQLILTLNKFGE